MLSETTSTVRSTKTSFRQNNSMYPSIRIHIESANGNRLLSGRLIDKDDETHIATIQPDKSDKVAKINLSHYACRGTAMMPSTLYYRRVSQEGCHACQ